MKLSPNGCSILGELMLYKDGILKLKISTLLSIVVRLLSQALRLQYSTILLSKAASRFLLSTNRKMAKLFLSSLILNSCLAFSILMVSILMLFSFLTFLSSSVMVLSLSYAISLSLLYFPLKKSSIKYSKSCKMHLYTSILLSDKKSFFCFLSVKPRLSR